MAGLTIDYTGLRSYEPGTVPSFAAAARGDVLTVTWTLPSNAVVVVGLEPDTTADGGTWTVTFDGDTTADLAFDASAPTIEAALEALSSVGVGNVDVTGTLIPAGAFTLTFAGALAAQPVGEVTADGTDLTGPDEPYEIAETSHTDGVPAGPKTLEWT